MKHFRTYLLASLLLLAAGQGAWAQAKTVKYIITSATQNGSSFTLTFGLASGSETPYDSFTSSSVTVDKSTATDQTVTLGDGFSLRLQWAQGNPVNIYDNGHGWNINSPGGSITYTVKSASAQYFVTGFRMMDNSGSTGMSDTNNQPIIPTYNYVSQLEQSYDSSASFGRLEITYTNSNTTTVQLSDFTQLGDGIYEIASKADLYKLAQMVNGGNLTTYVTFRQTADIECDSSFTPIGTMKKPFRGLYDGQGHVISGITVNRTGTTEDDIIVGLFGFVTGMETTVFFELLNYYETVYRQGIIQNVVLANSTFTGYESVGSIAGKGFSAEVINCRVESTVTVKAGANGAQHIGGIAGHWPTRISGSVCAATVSSNGKTGCYHLGGLVGFGAGTQIENSLFSGHMEASNASFVGGIEGEADGNAGFRNTFYICDDVPGAVNGGDIDGARRGRVVSLGSSITIASDRIVYDASGLTVIGFEIDPNWGSDTGYSNFALRTSNGTIYTGEGVGLVDLNYNGSVPSGKTAVFTVDGERKSGNFFTMPARDVTVGVEFISSDLYYLTGRLSNGFYWSTFYHGTERYTLPEGAAAYTLNSSYNLYLLGEDGRTIPADTPVVIISDKAEFFLTKSDDDTTVSINGGTNILRGQDALLDLHASHSGRYYILGVLNDTVGFYELKAGCIVPHKAYYFLNQ